MPTTQEFEFGFGGPLSLLRGRFRIVKPKDGGKVQPVMIRKSLLSSKQPCHCSRCLWNQMSGTERKIHRVSGPCYCISCEHHRDLKLETGTKHPNNHGHSNNSTNGKLFTQEATRQTSHSAAEIHGENANSPNVEGSDETLPNLTEEQEALLIQMIAEGIGQNKIATALGITKFQVRQLKQQIEEANQPANKMDKGKKGQDTAKTGPKHNKKSTIEVTIPTPDKHMNKKEIESLVKIIDEELYKMWERVASRFFGKTNRAIHPDDIRDKFTGRVG